MDLVREYDQNQQDQKQPNNPNKSTQTMHGGEPVCFQTMKVLLTAVVFPALTSLLPGVEPRAGDLFHRNQRQIDQLKVELRNVWDSSSSWT